MTERSLLTEGSEWSPVQEIVRLTFKSLHDIIKSQGKAIQNLEQALADKVDTSELTQTFQGLSRIIDAKEDSHESAVALERKAGRGEARRGAHLMSVCDLR